LQEICKIFQEEFTGYCAMQKKNDSRSLLAQEVQGFLNNKKNRMLEKFLPKI